MPELIFGGLILFCLSVTFSLFGMKDKVDILHFKMSQNHGQLIKSSTAKVYDIVVKLQTWQVLTDMSTKRRLATTAALHTAGYTCCPSAFAQTDNNLPTTLALTFTAPLLPASSSPCRCPWRGRPCTSSRTGRSWWRSGWGWSRWWNSPVRAATGHNGSPGWIEAPMGRLRPILEAEATAATLTAATPSHHTIDGGRAVGGC